MRWIGQPRKRVEDRRLLLGAGRFVDDLRLPGALHVAFVRSPHAHARVVRLGLEAARAVPGVAAVVTATELGPLGAHWFNPIVPGMKAVTRRPLASSTVRAVGEIVAAVAAGTPAEARDAAELVVVDYEVLAPVPSVAVARAPDAPLVHAAAPGNLALERTWRAGDPERAFTGAAAVVSVEVEQPRLAAVALEPRVVLASYDPHQGELAVWASTQAPFRLRADLATILDWPESRLRVVAPEVGGGFGVKGDGYPEDVVVAWLALRLGRPVKWVATRSEDVLTTRHGRGGVARGELALDADGTIRGVRAEITYALGSALCPNGGVPPFNHARCLPGAYRVPAALITTRAVYTTATSTGPFRGAGRPEGIYLMERLVDAGARALELDPGEIRRRNFPPPTAFPFTNAAGFVYDSGQYQLALDRTLALADWPRLEAERDAARRRGEVAGLGLASYVENAALGWESGVVRIERTGAITVVTGSSAHGQGHETTWAQIAADALGVDPDHVVVRHGDTAGASQGFGTFGSRSTALGGSALVRAAGQVVAKARRIAASLLEAAPDDVVHDTEGFAVRGAPGRCATWRAVAEAAHRGLHLADGDEPGLEATSFFRAEGETWSFGSCVVAVRIDPDTGRVRLARCVWVDDAGTIVNPLLAEGQLHGSYAQGAGQALLEAVAYDAGGQLLTGSLMDYALPRADDFPEPELGSTVTPSPRNPLGAKGLGEAGSIALPPAIVNAVVDALAPWGCRHLDLPLTPEKVWRVLAAGPGPHDGGGGPRGRRADGLSA